MTAVSPSPGSQADLAYETLLDLLVRLEIPPGSPLVETELTERIGVGRTPLRDAIHRLEMQRLVAIYPRRGTFATDINIGDLALITDVREELEGLAAAQAAQRATELDRAIITRLLARVQRPETRKPIDLDTTIHRTIYDAAHNHFLAATAEMYHNLSLRLWHLYIERLTDITSHVEEHRDVLRSVLDRNAGAAAAAARDHVRRFEASVSAVI
ncbi:MAG TPA: GntR family transcriptional regulator [Acidimicrobiia bacterium]|nr:GntR family transcriptional regulator [Acidimicrobiia bacterium]